LVAVVLAEHQVGEMALHGVDCMVEVEHQVRLAQLQLQVVELDSVVEFGL
jgi:hypothetical protein